MLYLDTSVLLVYTLTQAIEKSRYEATASFFAQLRQGLFTGATSFHALHEMYLFALANAPDVSTGSAYGKAALEAIPALPIQVLPLVSRLERSLHSRKFRALRDRLMCHMPCQHGYLSVRPSSRMTRTFERLPTSFPAVCLKTC